MSEGNQVTKEQNPFGDAVSDFISAIGNGMEEGYGVLSRGDVVALKRMDISVPAPSFWRLAGRHSGEITQGNERRWALLAKCMAVMAPLHHRKGEYPGKALRDSGFSASSDIRIARLLKSEGESFEVYVLSACRYLAARAQPVDWHRFAKLIVFQNERAKNDLAREFYSAS